MRGRVVLAAVLLCALVLGGMSAQARMARVCAETSALLREGALEQACARWDEGARLFSVLVTHDRVDEVSAAFARARAFAQAGTADEYAAEVGALLTRLALLAQYDRISVRSIL